MNHTCIPKVGVFLLHLEKLNFSQALNSCRTKNSELAHVISETRTTALSRLVKQMRVSRGPKRAYVGLDDTKVEGRFTTTMGKGGRTPTASRQASKHETKETKADVSIMTQTGVRRFS
jgi:hypothetical protein